MRITAFLGITLVVGLAVSTDGAVIKTIGQTAMPADSVFVRFEGLLRSSFGGPVLPNYTENGVYFDNAAHRIPGYPNDDSPTGTDLCTALFQNSGNYAIFPVPQTKVGWREFYDTTPSVTLWSDAEGTQLIGTFNIGISSNYSIPRFHGFESDVPFQRMSLTPPLDTIWIDDLQFVPEPGAGLVLLLGTAGILSLRRRARR